MEEDMLLSKLKKENDRLWSALEDIVKHIENGDDDRNCLIQLCRDALHPKIHVGEKNKYALPENMQALAFNQLCNDARYCSRCPVRNLREDSQDGNVQSCFEIWKELEYPTKIVGNEDEK